MTSTSPTTKKAGDPHPPRHVFDRDLRDLRDLFERHSDSVYASALAATEDPQAAGEITRQVFAELWHDRDRLAGRPRSVASVRAWLCAAAHDRARDLEQR
jgi:DNA-directed RNA polymerase specialized sigma24 family protein